MIGDVTFAYALEYPMSEDPKAKELIRALSQQMRREGCGAAEWTVGRISGFLLRTDLTTEEKLLEIRITCAAFCGMRKE